MYKLCLAVPYGAVQSSCNISSHETLRHCLSTLKRRQRTGHFSTIRGAVKTLGLYLLESMHPSQQVFQECIISNDLANWPIAFQWDKPYIDSSPDPPLFLEVGLVCETILVGRILYRSKSISFTCLYINWLSLL